MLNCSSEATITKFSFLNNGFKENQTFKLKEKYGLERGILQSDKIRYSLTEAKAINTLDIGIYKNRPKEDSVISLMNSFPDLNCENIRTADNSIHENGKGFKKVTLGSIVLFGIFKLTLLEENA